MGINDFDKKAAEELLKEFPGRGFSFFTLNQKLEFEEVFISREQINPLLTRAILYGIEHERKRRVNFVQLDPESMDALMKELEAQPHGTIRSLEEFRKTYFPLEQVGERHWRIKG